jgi:ABC-type transport system involved in cytochrome bd biosynthesis fused ATPase/permease subunit
MSGAESRLFQLLFLISVLPLIPSNKRLNLVILDEFEAGLDDESKHRVIHEFLPQLLSVTHHIIFVTPFDPPSNVDQSRVITVVKSSDTSTLEETR